MTNAWSLLYDEIMSTEDGTITFTIDTSLDNMIPNSKNENRFKYSESRIIKELADYISATYNQHYSAGDDKIQTLDLIDACVMFSGLVIRDQESESWVGNVFPKLPLFVSRI